MSFLPAPKILAAAAPGIFVIATNSRKIPEAIDVPMTGSRDRANPRYETPASEILEKLEKETSGVPQQPLETTW